MATRVKKAEKELLREKASKKEWRIKHQRVRFKAQIKQK